jgi:hydroxyacylglutathione hydrolase
MQVITLSALADNYIFLLPDENSSEAAVVDPGVAEPVLEYLGQTGRRLSAILNTHHHSDHTGGNLKLSVSFPGIPVYGGAGDRGRIPGQTHFLAGGDEILVSNRPCRIVDVPGHTRAHIAYFFAADSREGDLFSGDTVFGGTIGNLFEGTPEIMYESIRKIRSLPHATRIWCAHEYTLQYVRESAGLDPGNTRLAGRLKALEESSGEGRPTVPLLLAEECETNPFFRWDDSELTRHFSTAPGLETFRHLCKIT